ncbi:DNA mismatch repair protein Msh3p [[Candida] anglica]|uniref:DNA mismatch repair protein MSH3 n=1 Tax=[Candida] anglica TaxID=148631 RepID=A0ABP0E7X9_9ASCO
MTKVQRSISSFFPIRKKTESGGDGEGSSKSSNISIDLTEEDDKSETTRSSLNEDVEINDIKPQIEIEEIAEIPKEEKKIESKTVDSKEDKESEVEPMELDKEEQSDDSKSLTPEVQPKPKRRISSTTSRETKRSKVNPPAKKHAKTSSKLTPLEKQIVEFKRQHPDKVLAVQVGYKFKFFGPDAVVAARILNIMLVPGKINLEQEDTTHDKIAYCSIPDNRLHIHLQRLLARGLKVGVIKQTETAAIKSVEGSKSGLFERKVTAVYTRATYMDDELLTMGSGANTGYSSVEEDVGKFIICVDESDSSGLIGIVAVSPITGEIVYDNFEDNMMKSELETRLAYLCPSEIMVLNDQQGISKEVKKVVNLASIPNNSKVVHIQKRSPEEYTQQLTGFFNTVNTNSLIEFYAGLPSNIQSCVAELMQTLSEFQLSNVFTITSNVTAFSNSRKYMLLPGNTLQQLEIFRNTSSTENGKGSLIWLLNHTRTRMGSRLFCKWVSKPLVQRIDIEQRLDAVSQLKSGFIHFVESFMGQLDKIGSSGLDFEKCLIKVHYASTYNSDKIGRKEIFLFLKSISELLSLVESFRDPLETLLSEGKISSKLLEDLFLNLLDCSQNNNVDGLLNMINPSAALEEKDLIVQKTKFFQLYNFTWEEIENELNQIKIIEAELDNELQNARKMLKRPQLNYITNMKETHLIEVRNGAMAKSLPLNWIKISATKSVSRFRSPEITKLHKQLQYHNDMLLHACDRAYTTFLGKVDDNYEYLARISRYVCEFDCLLSLTAASTVNLNLCRPQFVDEQVIKVKQGRNPIIENLPHTAANYIPNDIDMSEESNRCSIITGPNMGGKSSYVREIALIVIMAQIGCYVPCESATLGVFDSIFTRMGAQDNIIKGESTFMVEMMECSNIIKNCTKNSLVILDEIGRGTGTTDGISIAYSILDYFINNVSSPLVLFITHYPSLGCFESMYPMIVHNYHMGFLEVEKKGQEWPDIVFLYTVVRGLVKNSYGLNVARLAGIPPNIVSRAHEMASTLKKDIEHSQGISFTVGVLKAFNQLQKDSYNPEKLVDTLMRLSSEL